jgi:hypothetical protein
MPLNTGIWTAWGTGAQDQSGGTLNQSPSGVSGEYTGVYSAATFDLTNKAVQIQIAQFPSSATGTQAVMRVEIDGNNAVIIGYSDNGLLCQHQITGTLTNVLFTAWPAGAIAMRIVFDNAQNRVWYDTYSPATGWTNRFSEAIPIATTALRVSIATGTYQAVASPGTGRWESVGLPIVRNLTTTSAGSATATGVVSRQPVSRYLVGNSAGSATEVGQPSAKRLLTSTSTGVATSVGTVSRQPQFRSLIGTAPGIATTTGLVNIKRLLTAASSGSSTVSASVSRYIGRYLGPYVSGGAATVSAQVARYRSLTVASLGVATVSATATRRRSLTATSAGTSTVIAIFGTPADAYGQAIYNHTNNIAYWRLSETSGTSARDFSKSGGHHGTYVGQGIASYSTGILGTSGLVAYYHLDETSGTTGSDSKGIAHGVYQGAPVLGQSGIPGTGTPSAKFGPNNYLRITYASPATDPIRLVNGPLTLEAWIKRNTINNANNGIISAGTGGYYLRIDSTNKLMFLKSQIGVIALSTATITDLNWHHVAATKSGATTKLYLDGVELAATVTDATLIDSTFPYAYVGSDLNGTETFDGWIDEAAIYNVALSSAQIASHYSVGSGSPSGLGVPGAISGSSDTAVNFDGIDDYIDIPDFAPAPETYYGLVKRDLPQVYYRLDEPSGASALDSSGNTKTGTFTGGTATRSQVGPLLSDSNTATRFTGTYVQAPLLTAFNGTTGFTIEVWVKSVGAWAAGGTQVFCAGDGTGNDQLIHCYIQGGGTPKLGFWFDDYDPGGTAMSTDTWHHVAFVFEGPSTKIQRCYVDGIQRGAGRTATGVPVIATGSRSGNGVQIGRVDGASVADCYLDEVAIYPVALTPTQVSDHFAARNAPTGAFAVEAWIKADVWGASTCLINRRTIGNVGGFSLEIPADGIPRFHIYTTGWNGLVGTRALAVGVWNHVVGVYAPGQSLLMVNGEDCGRLAFSGTINSPVGALFRIGYNNAGGQLTDGQIDEVAVYNVNIPDQTIRDHYHLGVKALDAYGLAVDRTSGLLAFLRLEEPSGSVFDSTGNGHSGTVGTTVARSQTGALSIADKALAFDGGTTTSFVDLSDVTSTLDIAGDLTLECWIKIASYANYWMLIINSDAPATKALYEYRTEVTTGLPSLLQANGTAWQFATAPAPAVAPPLNVWNHMVVTRSGTTVQHYLNGAVNGAAFILTGVVPAAPTTPVKLGARSDGYPYVGSMDEVAIYNRALTLAEIQEHYNKGISGVWRVNFTGNAPGTSTAGAQPTRRRSIVATSVGISTAAAIPTRRRPLTAVSPGTATGAGLLTARRSLLVVASGSTTVTATILKTKPSIPASPSNGVSTAMATIVRRRTVTGTSNGAATEAGQPTVKRGLLAASAGVGTASGNPVRTRALVVVSAGVATEAGQPSKKALLPTILSAGKATTTATASIKPGRIYPNPANGVGAASAQITIRSATVPPVTIAGRATVSASITRKKAIVAVAAGNTVTTGIATRRKALVATSAGKGAVTSNITRRRSLLVSTAGRATVTGLIERKVNLVVSAAGVASVSAILLRKRLIFGSSNGLTTTTSVLNASRVITGTADGKATGFGRPINIALILWTGSTFTIAGSYPVVLWDQAEFELQVEEGEENVDYVAYKGSTDQFNPVEP